MPKRKRSREAGPVPAGPPVDPALAEFARRQRQQEQERRDARQAERIAREQAARHESLLSAKDQAATRLKQERRTGGGARLADAEAAYGEALAALMAFERDPTGGPPVTPAPDSGSEPSGEAAAEGEEQAERVEQPEAAGE